MSLTVETLIANDFKMQYIKFGSGDKTLVIIPGLSIKSVILAAPAIEKQYEIFSRDFTVYLFEPRENLPKEYSVNDMAEDNAMAIKKLGLTNICLFGVSYGAMVAMIIAASHSELVSKLVIGSTAYKIDEKSKNVLSEWVSLAKQGKTEELCLSFAEKIYPKDFFEQNRDVFIAMAKTVAQSDLNRFSVLAQGTTGFDALPKLKIIKCSTLAIGDTDDSVFGAKAMYDIEEQMKNNPDFKLHMYSGFGHAVYDTAPDYTQRLFDFFK